MGACTNATNKFYPKIQQSDQRNLQTKRQKRSHSLEETKQRTSEVSISKQYLKKGRSTLLYNPQTPMPIITEISVQQFESKIDGSINSKLMWSGLIQKESSEIMDESKDVKTGRFVKQSYKSKNSYI